MYLASHLVKFKCLRSPEKFLNVVRIANSFQMDANLPKSHSQSTMSTATGSSMKKPGPKWHSRNKDVLRHIKYKEKLGGELPPPGLIELQAVGCGKGGSPGGLFVNMNHSKYMFNCGEGTQRLAMEHKLKMSKVEDIFITHRSWENVGGLMGMCLSLEGTCFVPKVRVHGPPAVEKLATMGRSFAQLHTLKIDKHEITDECFQDSATKIKYVPIVPADEPALPDDAEPLDKYKNAAVAYICTPHMKARSLSLAKCVDLGIPTGPHVKCLKEGKSVTLADGRLVQPDDVLDPPEICLPYLVVECPSKQYLEPFVTNSALSECHLQEDGESRADIVIHLTRRDVMETTEYQDWINKFGPTVKHMILNEDGSELTFVKLYSVQATLHLLHPHIFPLLPHQVDQSAYGPRASNHDNIKYGETNLKYIYRSRNAKIFANEMPIVLGTPDSELKALARKEEDLKNELEKFRSSQQFSDTGQTDDGKYPEILFLGTGSAIPNKVRNVSAILLHLSATSVMMLDCGENTYGQLYRHYGADRTAEILRNMKAVFISHMHPDHHMGLIGLARARAAVYGSDTCEPLTVLAPSTMEEWIDNVHETLFDVKHLVSTVTLESLYQNDTTKVASNIEHVNQLLSLTEFIPIRVIHAQWPHGVSMTHKDGWKLVYSGDTRPCDNLVTFGKDCDVLIHEATMEDDLADQAVDKKHSTTSEALDIGVQMNAKFILLTHFSQRYAKIPVFSEKFSSKVGIAFDNMKVNPNQFSDLPKLTPALKLIFADEQAELTEKMQKKLKRKQLEGETGKKHGRHRGNPDKRHKSHRHLHTSAQQNSENTGANKDNSESGKSGDNVNVSVDQR